MARIADLVRTYASTPKLAKLTPAKVTADLKKGTGFKASFYHPKLGRSLT